MSRGYHHLSGEERDHLAVRRSRGLSVRAIARALGRAPATLSRELKRNAPPIHTGYYLPHKAQARAEARWRAAGRRVRLRDPLVPPPRRRKRRGSSRRHTQAHIPARVAITERPAAANTRRQLGHWEADTMTTRQGRAALQLAVDRKSRYTVLNRLPRRTASAMRATLNRALARFPRPVRRTLTYDNGTEQVEHLRVNAVLGSRSSFCP